LTTSWQFPFCNFYRPAQREDLLSTRDRLRVLHARRTDFPE
jgi:hypothetical protein